MIPDSFIQELLDRVDIVDVVQRYVPLKKAGANYSACCPFHSEKSPSFTVSPTKQFYHCFGCGAHGSAIGFIMAHQGLGFVDAVEELAGNLGLTVPNEGRSHNPQYVEKKASMTELMAKAARFYKEQLKTSPKAIDYLKGRGLTGEIAARFGLGYAPEGWQALEHVFDDYKAPDLATVGLVIDNEQGRRYDRFRDRVMFPILDTRSNVIGFGGRVMGDDTPKYLNSPETPLFEKGRELYGLPQARKAIQATDTVLVVEGYMDVVGLAQCGVENVVATLGTAATEENIQRLLKIANRVIFCFDRDSAGDRAAERAMMNSLPYLADNKAVEILQMPGNQDPDEFIREHGKEAFDRHMQNATRLSEFIVRTLVNKTNPNTPEGRASLVHEAKPILQKIAAPIFRIQVTKDIATRAQVSQGELEALCELKPLAKPGRFAPAAFSRRPQARPLEHMLLEIILQQPTWASRIPLELVPDHSPEAATLHVIANQQEHGELPAGGVGMLLEHFRGTPHEEVISRFAIHLAEDNDPAELEAVLNDAVERIRNTGLAEEIAVLTAQARNGGLDAADQQRLMELLRRKSSAKPLPST